MGRNGHVGLSGRLTGLCREKKSTGESRSFKFQARPIVDAKKQN
jgi:hypothetical protein